MTPDTSRRWVLDAAIYAASLAVLLGAFAAIGLGYEGDTFSCLYWGRQIVHGEALDRINPGTTTPKILLIALGAVGQLVPGERGAELFYMVVVAAAGAGIVLVTSRLARRIGGTAAGLVAVPLVLGHMQLIQYVVSGQSPILASLFSTGALLLATREQARVRDHLWAAALLFGAAMVRPEAFALAGGLALALYLRLGWKRPWWPAVIAASGLAALGVNLLFHRFGFGSFSYNVELVVADTATTKSQLPSLHVGFAASVAKTLFHYSNRLWPVLLFAVLGVGLVVGTRRWRRYAALFALPLATIAAMWLLLFRGSLVNERCFYHMTFIVIALASGAIGWLASRAASSAEFLAPLSARGRATAFALLALFVLAPKYATRPVPWKFGHDYRCLEQCAEVVREHLAKLPGDQRPVVMDETSHVRYRLRLPSHRSFHEAIRVMRAGEGELPDAIEWYVTDMLRFLPEIPSEWRLDIVWNDPNSPMTVYRRRPRAAQESGS